MSGRSGGTRELVLRFETSREAPSGTVVVERPGEEGGWTTCPPGSLPFPGGGAWCEMRFETADGPCRVRFEFDEETGLPLEKLVTIRRRNRPDEERRDG